MPGTGRQLRTGGVFVGATLVLALLAGGCSLGGFGGSNAPAPGSTPTPTPTPAPEPTASSWSISNFFAGSSGTSRQTVSGAAPSANCPPVEIREGASTLTIGPPGDTTAMNLRYQGTFAREARECTVVDGNMVMKIGVQGRVIVGPGGGVGQVDVPLRFAVVQETPGGTRPIATKFMRIPVAITNTEQGGVFTHIEESMTFPLPAPVTALADYVVYVGFDPVTAAAQDKEAAQPKPKPKGKPKPKSTTNSSNTNSSNTNSKATPPSAFSAD
jgi:hypothetical protein